jgi:hypothetical protein
MIPFRLLKIGYDDRTPIYGRPFKCKACGSREVTLFAVGSQAELDAVQQAMAGPKQPAQAPTTHSRADPDGGLLCRMSRRSDNHYCRGGRLHMTARPLPSCPALERFVNNFATSSEIECVTASGRKRTYRRI